MLLLFISEISYWQTTKLEHHLLVDTSQGDREFNIELDMVFHNLTCKDIIVAAEDAKGIPYEDTRIKINKIPITTTIDPRIKRDNPDLLINTNNNNGGCRITGTVLVRKVAGVIYIAAARTLTNMDGRLAFIIPPETMASYDARHTINYMRFGPKFPKQVNPLDTISSPPISTTGAYSYHIRVVPTIYEDLYGNIIDSQQYSVSDFVQQYEPEANTYIHPGVWWKYDFAPTMVRMVETRRSFASFAISLCAILGGIFAISGIIDQVFYRAMESRKNK